MAVTEDRTRWGLHRADGMLLRVLLIALVVGYPALLVVPRLVAWASGQALEWASASNLEPRATPELSSPGVVVTRSSDVVWTLQDASAGQWLAALTPTLLTWVLLALGCSVAWRLVRVALSGEPFGPRSTRGLRLLGLVVVAYGVLVPTARFFASMAVLWPVGTAGALAWLFAPASFVVPLVIGLVVLVVAECFRIGQRMSDDVSGLV